MVLIHQYTASAAAGRRANTAGKQVPVFMGNLLRWERANKRQSCRIRDWCDERLHHRLRHFEFRQQSVNLPSFIQYFTASASGTNVRSSKMEIEGNRRMKRELQDKPRVPMKMTQLIFPGTCPKDQFRKSRCRLARDDNEPLTTWIRMSMEIQ